MCSVLMPRCEGWSATQPWLMPRNVNVQFPNGDPAPGPTLFGNVSNANGDDNPAKTYPKDVQRWAYSKSRNPLIDDQIKPGPYKELLPCEDLCYDIVRSCPAKLGFACPQGPSLRLQYGTRDGDDIKTLKCNFPGAVVNLNTVRAWAVKGMVTRNMWVLVAWVIGVAVVGTW